MLKTQEKAPDFSLPDQDDNECVLSDYRGMWVLLYFYPKDETPGCVKEAEAFRDAKSSFEELDVVIIGVSTDSSYSHKTFSDNHDLSFTLLSDEGAEVVELYGAWGSKISSKGNEYEGTFRTSFLIDTDGVIIKIYNKVKPETHAKEVLRDVKELEI